MKITAARRNAQLDNLTAQLNSGFCDIYAGTKPTDADTALSGNTLLASLPFGATAFAAASAGAAVANAITDDTSADATGTASFARCFASNHTTAIADLTVGVGSGELQLNTLSIVSGVLVEITALTFTQPLGA